MTRRSLYGLLFSAPLGIVASKHVLPASTGQFIDPWAMQRDLVLEAWMCGDSEYARSWGIMDPKNESHIRELMGLSG